MAHWSEKYVGRPYVRDDYDCGALAIEVQNCEFGRDITDLIEREQGLRARSAQIAELKAAYAEPTVLAEEGDGVLMISRGSLWHIGIYTEIAAVPYVLHAMENAGQVCLHRVRDLAGLGLQVEGYYRWR